MKALVIAGGFATRLRPLSCSRPKILFPIVNKPLVQWTLERLAKHELCEVIVAATPQTEIHIKHSRLKKNGVHIRYSPDPYGKPLGTGGPLKKAQRLIGNTTAFLTLNGDIFADVNYTALTKAHESHKDAVATIALHKVEEPSRFGVADLQKDNRIKRFIEKPLRDSAPSNLINAGVYVFNSRIFDYIPPKQQFSLERQVFPKLAEENLLYGCIHSGLWTDIGKPEDYLRINMELLEKSDTDWEHRHHFPAKLMNPVALDRNVTIGKASAVGPYVILGQDVKLGESVKIRRSVILGGTTVDDSCSIDGAIIGEGVTVGQGAEINRGCIIGDRAKIGDNIRLAKGVTICPATEVTRNILSPTQACQEGSETNC